MILVLSTALTVWFFSLRETVLCEVGTEDMYAAFVWHFQVNLNKDCLAYVVSVND